MDLVIGGTQIAMVDSLVWAQGDGLLPLGHCLLNLSLLESNQGCQIECSVVVRVCGDDSACRCPRFVDSTGP